MFRKSLLAAACLLAASVSASALTLTQEIIGDKGQTIGNVRIETAVNGVLVRVFLEKDVIPMGWHGMHFHMVGDCSDVGKFKKSGGHMGLIPGGHGLKNPRGPEFGDMPNLYVPHQHTTNVELYVPGVSIIGTATDGSVLLDEDGSALVIHADEDDHISQPIGNSGARIACAQLSK